jgi:perosamine synthetase
VSIAPRPLSLLSGIRNYDTNTFPIDRAHLSRSAEEFVLQVLRSGQWSMFTSPHIELFEREFAEYVGAKHAVMLNSCTTALMACFAALGLGPGKSVVAPAFTYVGSCLPAVVLGAHIRWVDIGSDHQSIDSAQVEGAIDSGFVDAVIFPALFGACDGYQEVTAVCAKSAIPLIFDCAQFLGDRSVTSHLVEHGLCCFSFGESKILRIGEGGAVATNSQALAEQIRLFRHEGEAWSGSGHSRVAISDVAPQDVLSKLRTVSLGLNLRPLAVAAALGRSQLMELGEFLGATARNAGTMRSGLLGAEGLQLPVDRSIWWTFPVVLEDEKIDRDTFLAALIAEGIPAGVHFPNLLPEHPIFSTNPSKGVRYPNASRFASRHIVLPVYPRLRETHIRLITECIRKVLSSSDLSATSTKQAANEYLQNERLRELSAGLYLFTQDKGFKNEQARN